MNMAIFKSRRVRIYLLFAVPLLLLVFITGSKATVDYTSTPSFCGSCHLMQTRYISYRRSLHKDSLCLDCHSNPGVIGTAEAKLNGLKYLYYGVMGYRDVQILRAHVSNESCMRCHDIKEMDRRMLAWIDPVQHPETSHKSHVLDLKFTCTVCHGNIMHVNLEGQSKKALGSCKDCHKQTEFTNLTNKLVF